MAKWTSTIEIDDDVTTDSSDVGAAGAAIMSEEKKARILAKMDKMNSLRKELEERDKALLNPPRPSETDAEKYPKVVEEQQENASVSEQEELIAMLDDMGGDVPSPKTIVRTVAPMDKDVAEVGKHAATSMVAEGMGMTGTVIDFAMLTSSVLDETQSAGVGALPSAPTPFAKSESSTGIAKKVLTREREGKDSEE